MSDRDLHPATRNAIGNLAIERMHLTAEEVALLDRYARGEINAAEYERTVNERADRDALLRKAMAEAAE